MTAHAEQMHAVLAQAGDAQIARVVAMVDAMPQRGDADGLIAPLRSRLAQLRPARPLSFTRLLFTPLDPVIVTLAEWQRSGAVGIPRPALPALGAAIQAALPRDGVWAGDAHDGDTLWEAAATVLDRLELPPGWTAKTGLAVRHFTTVAAACCAVLHEAVLINTLAGRRRLPEEDALRAILSRAKTRGAAALDTVVAVLLARLPGPAQILAIAAEIVGSDRATEQTLDRLGASLSAQSAGAGDPKDAALEVTRVSNLLTALEPTATPERRKHLDSIRREADGFCRRTFNRAVAQTVALAEKASAAPDDSTVGGMEEAARDLRRLEGAFRRLGAGEQYDAALIQAAAAIQDKTVKLAMADRVRIIEILSGPEAALELLTRAS